MRARIAGGGLILAFLAGTFLIQQQAVSSPLPPPINSISSNLRVNVAAMQMLASQIRNGSVEKSQYSSELEKNVSIRIAVVSAVLDILIAQESYANPDLACVRKCARFLAETLRKDPDASVKDSAVFALSYLYSKKFESERSVAVDALIESLEKPKTDSRLKRAIIDALEALTNMYFGANRARWREWQKSAK